MDYRRSQIPAFGNWECDNHFPFTQRFESVRQPGLVRNSTTYCEDDDVDLYVAGDLYENDVATPAMPKAKSHYPHRREGAWEGCEVMESPSPVSSQPPPPPRKAPKPVDEDLYKISPELLRSNPKTKRRWGFFSSCLMLTCG